MPLSALTIKIERKQSPVLVTIFSTRRRSSNHDQTISPYSLISYLSRRLLGETRSNMQKRRNHGGNDSRRDESPRSQPFPIDRLSTGVYVQARV